MNLVNETPFRVVFGVFWTLFYVVRIYFLVKAKGAKISFTIHEKRDTLFAYIFGYSGISMFVYVVSTWFDFGHVPLPGWVRYLFGGGILIAYLILFSWSHHALGRNWSGFLDIHQDHSLVTSGPYRYVRHPMYSSWFLSSIGYFLLSANWFIATIYFAPLTLMYLYRVPLEERMMIENFGDPYREYMKNTGRLLPRLRM